MKFKLSHSPSAGPADGKLLTDRERKKLLFMTLLFAVVGGGMIWGWVTGGGPAPQKDDRQRRESAPQTEIATPTFRRDELAALTVDGTREERADIEPAALALALEDARLYAWDHFAPMGGVELTSPLAAELAAHPAAARARVLRLRGRISEFVSFPEAGSLPAHFRALLTLDDGGRVFVVFQSCVDYEFGNGDYVHVDGLFLKTLGREIAGAWVEAPLVVGPRAQVSYPALGKVASLARADWGEDFRRYDEVSTSEREEYWRVVSYARDVDPASIDWSKARTLDAAAMAELSEDPASFLALPLRIPPCRIQDIWTQRQRENPARVTTLTEGWIGANEWLRTPNPVIQFSTLLPDPGYKIGSEVTARGFFVRMNQYEAVGGTRKAPVFVLTALEPYELPKENVFSTVLYIVGGSFASIVALFWYLLRRDRAKAAELDAELTRRRRERRIKAAAQA
ncbi:MAG: hypothetical protein FJ298_11210 [Planctomycetes bacterium]|nr:hypothetical protein [Planctomycetota bacterium]